MEMVEERRFRLKVNNAWCYRGDPKENTYDDMEKPANRGRAYEPFVSVYMLLH